MLTNHNISLILLSINRRKECWFHTSFAQQDQETLHNTSNMACLSTKCVKSIRRMMHCEAFDSKYFFLRLSILLSAKIEP